METAKKLGISQPAVSKQLQNLQSFYTVALFQMKGRKKNLSPLGEAIARLVLSKVGGIDVEVRNLTTQFVSLDKMQVKIGGRREILKKWIQPLCFEGTLELQALSGLEIEKKIRKQELDMAIDSRQILTSDYVAKTIFKSKYCLIAPKTWIKKADSLPQIFENLIAKPFASYDLSRIQIIEKLLRDHSVMGSIKVNFAFSDWESIVERVQNQLNWSLVPREFVIDQSRIKLIDLNSSWGSQEFYLYYKKNFKFLADEILKQI